MRRDASHAIADPTRREIIRLIAQQPMNLNAVAGHFRQSRPAISRHVRILRECGLLSLRKNGRERYCEAKLNRLNEVSQWVEQYKAYWNTKLDALERYLEQTAGKDNPRIPAWQATSRLKTKKK